MHFLILFLLISSVNSYDNASESFDNQIITESNNESLYLGTHLATSACAYVTSLSVILLSFALDEYVGKNKSFTVSTNSHLDLLCRSFPSIVGVITGAWIFYKAPQWTDTYIIKKKDKRTFSQNMTAFFSRIILNYPLGVIFGEVCNKETKVKIAPKFLFLYFLIS